MVASSWVARSPGGLDPRDGGGVVVECGGVLAGELDSDVGGETEGEAEVETVRELGEPPVAVHPDTINATAPSITPAARMPHILPAGPERGPRRAPARGIPLSGSVLGPTKTAAARWGSLGRGGVAAD
jgi:hypothetical protein